MAAKLNRDTIARTGLQLLDKAGIEGVTLRALAAELGVQAPTLYWHVKSKQDILQAMAVAISQDAAERAAAVDPRAPWRERLTDWAYALLHSILQYRDGGRVFAGTFAPDPATFRITEAALQAWQDSGLSMQEAAQRTVLMRHFIVGFCIEEQELATRATERDQDKAQAPADAPDPTQCPLTAQALPLIIATGIEERFEIGLQLLLGPELKGRRRS